MLNCKITRRQKIKAYGRWKAGENRADLAREYGVSYSAMYQAFSNIERRLKYGGPAGLEKWAAHSSANPRDEKAIEAAKQSKQALKEIRELQRKVNKGEIRIGDFLIALAFLAEPRKDFPDQASELEHPHPLSIFSTKFIDELRAEGERMNEVDDLLKQSPPDLPPHDAGYMWHPISGGTTSHAIAAPGLTACKRKFDPEAAITNSNKSFVQCLHCLAAIKEAS